MIFDVEQVINCNADWNCRSESAYNGSTHSIDMNSTASSKIILSPEDSKPPVNGPTIGTKIGRWTILSYSGRGKDWTSYYKCQCDCGTVRDVGLPGMKLGRSTSCGCYARQHTSEVHTTHGATHKPGYKTWESMMARCYNTNSDSYHNYGGRGIIVCERWHSPNVFISDMGPRPSVKHSIDRINNDGNYEPSNCRWSTSKVQRNNSRQNVYVILNGTRVSATQAEELTGLSRRTMYSRNKAGWPNDKLAIPSSRSIHWKKTEKE